MSVTLSDAAARLAAKLLDDEISRGGQETLADYHLLVMELAMVSRVPPSAPPLIPATPVAARAVAAAPVTFLSMAPVEAPAPMEVVAGEAVRPHASAPPHASPA